MRYRVIAAVAGCVVVVACADRPTQMLEAPRPPQAQVVAAACPTPVAMENLIETVVPPWADRSYVLTQFSQIRQLLASEPPNVAAARSQAVSLISFLLNRYAAGRLVGGKSVATQNWLLTLANGLLCIVGLPQAFGPGSLGPDGAAAVISPTTPDTVIVTQTLTAGLSVPAASVTEPTVVTIRRLPNSPGPLLTALDQYPLFYEFNSSPAQPFTNDLVAGLCVASNAEPPNPSRLRLAHNVAPFTPGSVAILPLAPAPFLDCTNAPIASASPRWGFDLARAGAAIRHGAAALLLPQPLLALPYFSVGGIGGTVRTFSPFGAVDTLGSMSANSPIEFHGLINGPANGVPSVLLRTPTGRPMRGVPVVFALTSGGGSIARGNTVTDINGVATAGTWTLGPIAACSTVLATATMPVGSGLSGSPITFFGCAR